MTATGSKTALYAYFGTIALQYSVPHSIHIVRVKPLQTTILSRAIDTNHVRGP